VAADEDIWANIPGASHEDAEAELEAEREIRRAIQLKKDAQSYVTGHKARELAKRIIAEEQAKERGPLSARVHDRRSMRTLDLPKHLMRDVLYTGAVAVVLGDSQVGKSWVTQSISCCGAAGVNWPTMQPNTKGVLPVLYIAAEDGGALEWRVRHWENAHDRNLDDAPLYSFVEPINLLDETVIEELCALVRERGIRILVADTVSATFGGEEESNPEFARLVRHCRRITAAMAEHGGGAVILNHHFGKDKERGGRGGSALFNDCDIVWELTGDIDDITMTNKKWKVDEKRKTLKLRLDKTDRHKVHIVEQERSSGSVDVTDQPTETSIMELEIVRAIREMGDRNRGYGPTKTAIIGRMRERGAQFRDSQINQQIAVMIDTGRILTEHGPRNATWHRLPPVQEAMHDGG
jgi:hypothetical protein